MKSILLNCSIEYQRSSLLFYNYIITLIIDIDQTKFDRRHGVAWLSMRCVQLSIFLNTWKYRKMLYCQESLINKECIIYVSSTSFIHPSIFKIYKQKQTFSDTKTEMKIKFLFWEFEIRRKSINLRALQQLYD